MFASVWEVVGVGVGLIDVNCSPLTMVAVAGMTVFGGALVWWYVCWRPLCAMVFSERKRGDTNIQSRQLKVDGKDTNITIDV